MKRRTILRNAASAGMLAFGATAAVAATTEDDPEVTIRDEETGEYVTKPVSETDVAIEDCCVADDCSFCDCRCCYC